MTFTLDTHFATVIWQKSRKNIKTDGASKHLATIVVGVVANNFNSAGRCCNVAILLLKLALEGGNETIVASDLVKHWFAVQIFEIGFGLGAVGKLEHSTLLLLDRLVISYHIFLLLTTHFW